MYGGILSIVVGVVVIIIGILNSIGKIKMLHSYHTRNVAEEDKVPFGKRVGLGMFFVGVGLILMGGALILADLQQNEIIFSIGEGLFAIAFGVGICIIILALKKYNGGVFK